MTTSEQIIEYCKTDAVVSREVWSLIERRRRARRQQRLAIALCLIGAVIILIWEFWNASF